MFLFGFLLYLRNKQHLVKMIFLCWRGFQRKWMFGWNHENVDCFSTAEIETLMFGSFRLQKDAHQIIHKYLVQKKILVACLGNWLFLCPRNWKILCCFLWRGVGNQQNLKFASNRGFAMWHFALVVNVLWLMVHLHEKCEAYCYGINWYLCKSM